MSIKTLKNIDFLVNNDIGHLIVGDFIGIFWPQKKFRKVIENIFIIL